MRLPARRLASWAFIVSFLNGRSAGAAGEIPYEWTDVRRILAVGDIHGDYEQFVAVLKNAGLVDDRLRWIGGETHLVQTGDVVDRGPESRKCIELLMKLERQADRAGGAVHALIGNHEAMNILGFLDYVSPEEFASYANAWSGRTREAAFEAVYRDRLERARETGESVPPVGEARSEFESKYPLGYVEHRRAFHPDGEYGRWILSHNVSVRINGIVFSHGDWSEELAVLGLEEVNQRVRDELRGRAPLEEGIAFHPRSPMQYRGLSEVPLTRLQQESHQPMVDRILKHLGAIRMVSGHTLTDGMIEPRFGGKHIGIDTGMARLYQGGRQIALEIDSGVLSAIHPLGKIRLPDYLDETTLPGYLREVSLADPENVTVHTRLADELLRRGERMEAKDVLERLYRIPKPVPFTYRRELAAIYADLDQPEKARAQARYYLEGLQRVIRERQDNIHVINLAARFCLEENLELDLAEDLVAQGLEREPGNPTLLMTLGRLHLARGRFGEAARAIESSMATHDAGYEGYYHLGLAYLGLDEKDKARQAFEQAVELEPDRAEAREELSKLNGQNGKPVRKPRVGRPRLPAPLAA